MFISNSIPKIQFVSKVDTFWIEFEYVFYTDLHQKKGMIWILDMHTNFVKDNDFDSWEYIQWTHIYFC